MMATNVGNLNIRLGMSTDKLNADVNTAIGNVKSLDRALGSSDALNPRNRGSTTADNNSRNAGFQSARIVQQLGFGAQDFASQLQNSKNALDGVARGVMAVSNNVQMLGSAFGPTGLAVTAIGGAIGSIIVPAMIRWVDLSADATKEAERTAAGLQKQIDLLAELRAAQRAPGADTDSGKPAADALKEEQKKIREAEEAVKEMNRQLAEAANRVNDATERDRAAHDRMVAGMDVPGRLRSGLNMMAGGTGIAESAATANAKKEESILRESLKERERQLQEARQREASIQKEFGADIREAEDKADRDAREKAAKDRIKDYEEQKRDEKAFDDWVKDNKRKVIDDEIRANDDKISALQDKRDAFGDIENPNGSSSASIRGTGAAASAINRALAGTRSVESDAKKQIKLLEDQLKELRKANEKAGLRKRDITA